MGLNGSGALHSTGVPPVIHDPEVAVVVSDVMRRMSEVAAAEAALAAQKQRVRDRVVELGEVLESKLGDMTKNQVLALADYLYWDTDVQVSVRGGRNFMSALGVLIPSNAKHPTSKPALRPRSVTVACTECGEDFEMLVYSRSDRDKADHLDKFTYRPCDPCREARSQRSAQSVNQYVAEREAWLVAARSMPYSEYLQTDHWKRTRLAALKRAGYRCSVCNASGTTLDVHHRTYERRGEEHSADVIALCRGCHTRFHFGEGEA